MANTAGEPPVGPGSQFGQDEFLDSWVFDSGTGGVFLDVGAFDGVTGSNTLFFERERGWTGLLVEPVAELLDRARSTRAGRCVGVAVGADASSSQFLHVVDGFVQMSGLVEHYSAEMLARLRCHPQHHESIIEVEVVDMGCLVELLGVGRIDLVCIDIEGAEVAALRGFPFDRVEVGAWCIENNSASDEIEHVLAEHDFGLVRRLGPDEIYVARPRVEAIHRRCGWSAVDEAADLLDNGFTAHGVKALRGAVSSDPSDSYAWHNLGVALRRSGEPAEAMRAHRRAVTLEPDSAAIRRGLKRAALESGDLDDALRLAGSATDPDGVDRVLDLRVRIEAAKRVGDVAGAIDAAEEWSRIEPGAEQPHLETALALLAAGDFERGFIAYEARRQIIPGISWPGVPEWQGEPLAGLDLLVVGEQGLGDQVMFARFLPMLRRLGPAGVTVAVADPLVRLFEGVEGVDDVIVVEEVGELLHRFDRWVPLATLPARLGAGASLPPPVPVRLPRGSVERANQVLGDDTDRLRVGIVWSGNGRLPALRRRHIEAQLLMPLLQHRGVQWHSLAKPAPGLTQLSDAGIEVVDASVGERDLADTAAVCARMDLVITVCTLTAHLAPAVGVPTWVLLADRPYWAWGVSQSSWYPHVRQFRQTRPGDWSTVIEQAAAELADICRARRRGTAGAWGG